MRAIEEIRSWIGHRYTDALRRRQRVFNPDGAVRIFPLSGGTILNALVSMTGVHFLP